MIQTQTLIQSELDYDIVSDKVLSLADGLNLLISSRFSRKNKDDKRQSYISEYEYSSKYIDKKSAYMIRRENTTSMIQLKWMYDNSLDLVVSIDDLFMFKEIVKQTFEYCLNPNNFTIDKQSGAQKLKKVKVFNFIVSGYVYRSVAFEPIVILDAKTEQHNRGVKYYVTEDITVDIPIEKFSALYSVIADINLYMVFQNHATFLAAWKKENYGKCLIRFGNNMKPKIDTSEELNKVAEGDVNVPRIATGHRIKPVKLDDL